MTQVVAFPGFGLLLASPALLLGGGKRELMVRFVLDPDSLSEARAALDAIQAAAPGQTLRHACGVAYSGQSGWVPVPGCSLRLVEAAAPTVVLDFALAEDQPACVPNRSFVTDDSGPAPLLKLDFGPAANLCLHVLLRLRLRRAELEVHVSGLRGLAVQGPNGPLPSDKPFAPFGPIPQCGMGFTVSHPELDAKRIEHVELHLDWDDFLDGVSSLHAYYHDYGTLQFDDAQFKVRMEAGSGAQWQTVGMSDSSSLFVGGDYTRSSFAADLPETVSELRLTLAGPPYAFGHRQYPALLADQALANAASLLRRQKGGKVAPLVAIAAPLSPMATGVTLDYIARDSLLLKLLCEVGPAGQHEILNMEGK